MMNKQQHSFLDQDVVYRRLFGNTWGALVFFSRIVVSITLLIQSDN